MATRWRQNVVNLKLIIYILFFLQIVELDCFNFFYNKCGSVSFDKWPLNRGHITSTLYKYVRGWPRIGVIWQNWLCQKILHITPPEKRILIFWCHLVAKIKKIVQLEISRRNFGNICWNLKNRSERKKNTTFALFSLPFPLPFSVLRLPDRRLVFAEFAPRLLP